MANAPTRPSEQRIDRWLWFTRLLKSRTLAAMLASSGKLRVNGERLSKASKLVKPGDVLTFPLGEHIRIVKVLDAGTRRGPASEARLLYEDMSP
ncbi:MAG TPA: RNA-binding S4 domain-containing protein, partial [Parvibaculum sp.]